jgi:hypothetical protein
VRCASGCVDASGGGGLDRTTGLSMVAAQREREGEGKGENGGGMMWRLTRGAGLTATQAREGAGQRVCCPLVGCARAESGSGLVRWLAAQAEVKRFPYYS